MAPHTQGCAAAGTELPRQEQEAAPTLAVVALLLGAIGYLRATCYRELYYYGDLEPWLELQGIQNGRGDATLAHPTHHSVAFPTPFLFAKGK